MTTVIKPTDFYILYSPSFCELRLYLSKRGVEPSPPGAFAQLIFQLGHRHEKSHLSTFPSFSDLTGISADKTLEEIRKGSPVIYQGELKSHVQIDGKVIEVVGIPDFMIKVPQGYIIRECKLARHATEDKHPEILRQLQVYGWLFEESTGNKPLRLDVLKGDGVIESIDYSGANTVLSYIGSVIDIILLHDEPYSPVGWSKCSACGYHDYCMSRALNNQDIALVYDLDQNLAKRLREMGVTTLQELLHAFDEKSLSELKRPWGAREQKVGKKAESILLQARAMVDKKGHVTKKPELPVSQNFVTFDLEGLPPQLDESDKIYLWGMQVFGEDPSSFLYSLAETGPAGDRAGWEQFLSVAANIFGNYGDIPFIHWHHYEKTKIKSYLQRYGDTAGVAERVLRNLFDLLTVTRNSVVIPEMSYSLKVVEKYIGFKRTQDEYGGDWSIAKYIEAIETEDEAKGKSLINEILKYNEEDLKATWAVFEWLKTLA